MLGEPQLYRDNESNPAGLSWEQNVGFTKYVSLIRLPIASFQSLQCVVLMIYVIILFHWNFIDPRPTGVRFEKSWSNDTMFQKFWPTKLAKWLGFSKSWDNSMAFVRIFKEKLRTLHPVSNVICLFFFVFFTDYNSTHRGECSLSRLDENNRMVTAYISIIHKRSFSTEITLTLFWPVWY